MQPHDFKGRKRLQSQVGDAFIKGIVLYDGINYSDDVTELVPQDPNDEPATNLLRRMAQSKPEATKGAQVIWRPGRHC